MMNSFIFFVACSTLISRLIPACCLLCFYVIDWYKNFIMMLVSNINCVALTGLFSVILFLHPLVPLIYSVTCFLKRNASVKMY